MEQRKLVDRDNDHKKYCGDISSDNDRTHNELDVKRHNNLKRFGGQFKILLEELT